MTHPIRSANMPFPGFRDAHVAEIEAGAVESRVDAIRAGTPVGLTQSSTGTGPGPLAQLRSGRGFALLPKATQDALEKALLEAPDSPAYVAHLVALAEDGGPYQEVALGSEGPAVSALQRALEYAGFSLGQVNGKFGTETEAALKAFQQARNLPATGAASAQTLSELHQHRFSALPPEIQEKVVSQLALHAGDDSSRELVSLMALSTGFRTASSGEQQRWLRLLGGRNPYFSQPLRECLRGEMRYGRFPRSSPEAQRAWLQQNIVRVSDADAASEGRPTVKANATFTVSKPTPVSAYRFNSGHASAQRYELRFGKQVILVYVPDKIPPGQGHHPSIHDVARGLDALPLSIRRSVNAVALEPKARPGAAMSAGQIAHIRVYPIGYPWTSELAAHTLIHEVGHVVSMRAFGSILRDDWGPWEAAMARDDFEASEYAKTNRDEDFAETYQLHQQVINTPYEAEIRALMPERFAIIDEVLHETQKPVRSLSSILKLP